MGTYADLIVAKFGGTSVANASQIEKVAEIIRADDSRRIVVVSAPGKRNPGDEKITNTLIACHGMASMGEAIGERFAPVRARFQELARDLGIGGDMDPWIDEVESLIRTGASQAAVVSRGEYLAAHMVARYLGFTFVDAADIVVFSGPSTVDAGETHRRVTTALSADGRYVVPGFYGASIDGTIRLFSRGGSDISASVIAGAVRARVYENWTDVSGLLAADPRIVSSPRAIGTVSYPRMRELAFLGAAVFHPEAVAPAEEAGVPINIRNTNEPDHPGTRIVPPGGEEAAITGVAGRTGLRALRCNAPSVGVWERFLAGMAAVVDLRPTQLVHTDLGAHGALVVLTTDGGLDVGDTVGALLAECGCESIDDGGSVAIVGVVGPGVAEDPTLVTRIAEALRQADIPVISLSWSPGAALLYVVVSHSDYEGATNALYTVACR